MDAAVADLDVVRQRRRERFERIAEQVPHHPALRWCANGNPEIAHRRRRDTDQTICGLPAVILVLAPAGVPMCPDCTP